MKKLLITLPLLLAMSGAVYAADVQTTPGTTSIVNPFKGAGGTLQELFTAIINNIIIPIGSVLAVVAFIWAGFLFVTAGGDEGKIKTARSALLYAAIGTAVLLGASVISSVLQNTIDSLK